MSDAAKVIHWNGRDLPEVLRDLAPGEYTIERVESVADAGLTPEEEEGIRDAIRSLDRGEGIPWETVHADLRARIAAREASGSP